MLFLSRSECMQGLPCDREATWDLYIHVDETMIPHREIWKGEFGISLHGNFIRSFRPL